MNFGFTEEQEILRSEVRKFFAEVFFNDVPVPAENLLGEEGRSWGTTVIGGGTPNVQKNIIAERILGLPRD